MSSTLTAAPLAPLLDRLFAEADASDVVRSVSADLSAEERTRLMRSKTDYLARVRSPAAGYLSLPFGEDVELSVRLG